MKTLNLVSLLFLVLMASAQAQVKHLVFDLDGLLIQGVPQRNVEKIKDKDNLLTVDERGVSRIYYAAPLAAQVLRSLNNQPQILIHFFSANDPRWVHSVLNKIYVNKEKGITLANLIEADSASKFLTSEHLVNGKIDLRKITSDLANVVYFTTKKGQLVQGQEGQEFYTGQNHYVFEDYASAAAERARVGSDATHAPYLPKDEESWFLERNRFPRLNAAVRKVLKVRKGSFINDLQAAFQEGPREKIALGVKQTSDDWKEIGLNWIIVDNKVKGCGEFNNVEDRLLQELDLSKCLAKLTVIHELIIDQDKKVAQACGLYTSPDKNFIKKLPFADCLDKVTLHAYWLGKERNQCVYYTPEAIRVAAAPAKKCSNVHYMLNPFTEEFEVVEEVEDFDSLSLEEIFNRNTPTPEKVYQLWHPYDKDPTMGFTLNHCRDPKTGHHTIKEDASGRLLDECKPDTLYSWGPQGKLNNLKLWMGDGEWQKEYRPLFMARSPVGTFGYGAVPLRIKLRPNLKWVRTNQSHLHCDSYPVADKWNTVFYRPYNVRSNGTYILDYTVCSPGPIESWSYGHKELYDEVVKEYVWVLDPSHKANDYELYMSGSTNPLIEFRMGIDGYDFSDATLVRFLRNFISMIQSKDQKIYWNPTIPKDKRTKKSHFQTSAPIYYNHK